MTPDLMMEYSSLQERATQMLKQAASIEGYNQVFSFSSFPSFSPSFRWTLYRPHRRAMNKQPFAAFTIWRRDVDLENLQSPVERLKYPKDLTPTIEEASVELSEAELQDMEEKIIGIPIPLYLPKPNLAGLDGTRFEFQFDQYLHSGTIQWWENHPAEWQPFISALMAIINALEKQRSVNRATPSRRPH